MAEYVYPTHMRDTAYENRKITLSIKTPSKNSSVSTAIRASQDKMVAAAKFVKSVSSTVKEVSDNFYAHSKSKSASTVDTIVLPLPNVFNDAQSHGWSEQSGILGSVGGEIMNNSITSIIGENNIVGKIMSSVTLDKTIGAASSSAGLRKPLIDPGFFQNYSGSSPRTFNMQWDLVPNSASEAADIMMIIMKLKQYSSPSKTINGVSLLAPYFINVKMNNKFLTAMINIDSVVITNISVDYGADGHMQQTHDGMPKFMTLSLTLQSVDMATADDYSSVPALPS